MIQRQKGCIDLYGREAKIWKYVESVIDATMEKYNYNYIRTPIFEATELFHRGVGETTDIVTKESYDFVDKGDRKITLRPEGTAGVVRSYIENKMYGDPNQPVKVYYNGTMYRYERPQSGRDRELTQFGMEILGSDDPLSDAEIISAAVNVYKMLGLKEIKVNLNTLGDTESRNNYRKALINYFKPHIDELCEDCRDRLEKNPLRILDCKVDSDNPLLLNAPTTLDYLNDESRDRFEKVQEYLDIMQIKYEINPRIVRGLDYYNHTVFEIEAKVEGFGSNNVIGAGGRYNGLVNQLGGPETPCVGFASGIGRLVMALELEEVKLPIVEDVDLFLMYVNEDEKKYAAYLTQELRLAGFIVETEYTGRNLKGQFKQADRLGAKFLAILNSEDLNNNEVKIKNNKTKEEEVISLDVLIYYLDEKLNCGEEEYEDECSCGGECQHECSCHECHHE
ncbi:MAG: histidine--tRNA ligase [Tenericutes bacterium]|nr:histidine--tRNA ligase [Mycoplasmatota bacterium]